MDRIQSLAGMASSVAHALQRRELPSAESPIKWIVGGSIAGAILVAVLGFAFFFHFRRRKRDRLEHDKDLQEMDDYGLTDHSTPSRGVQRDDFDDDAPEVTAWPQRGQSSLRQGGTTFGASVERQGQGQQGQDKPGQGSLV